MALIIGGYPICVRSSRGQRGVFLKRLSGHRERATPGKPKPPGDLKNQLAGLGDFLARKITVTGTFNPLAAAGLGAGDAEERTARNTEQIARHTKRLADAAAVGRLSFA